MIADPCADPLSPALRLRVDAAASAVVEFMNGGSLQCPPAVRRQPKRSAPAPKFRPRAQPNWARTPLAESELAIIAAYRWPTFGAELTAAIAEGWNAGSFTADMAARIGAKPGSLRLLIGKLTQVGVSMRRVAPPRAQATPVPTAAEAPPEPKTPSLRRFSWERA